MHQPGVPVTFDWIEYLKLAKELASDPALACSEEAKLRSAVSRAYYAIYKKAEKIVFPKGHPRGLSMHWEVAATLQESDDPARRLLGSELTRLNGYRKKADYDDTAKWNLHKVARDTLMTVDDLIASLQSF